MAKWPTSRKRYANIVCWKFKIVKIWTTYICNHREKMYIYQKTASTHIHKQQSLDLSKIPHANSYFTLYNIQFTYAINEKIVQWHSSLIIMQTYKCEQLVIHICKCNATNRQLIMWCFHNSICNIHCVWIWSRKISICFDTNANTFTKFHNQ
jgi:hypothetical protein